MAGETVDKQTIREALRVELETDRLLGLRMWPAVAALPRCGVLRTQALDAAECEARGRRPHLMGSPRGRLT